MTCKGGNIVQRVKSWVELRDNYDDISKLCHEGKGPVIITVDGKEDTVIIDIEAYYQMKGEIELLRKLSEAEEAVKDDKNWINKESLKNIINKF